MKFTRLGIENFLAIKEASVSLDGRGLLLIAGANKDDSSAESNGAGKSSIADALSWVLYGVTARGESGDAVVNRTAGKGTFVEVVVEDGDEEYFIRRYRKHATGKNSLRVLKADATLMSGRFDLTKGTDKLTQEVVDKIIGSSYEVFRSSICAGQESFPDLPGMTDKMLKMLVEEAAGTTVLEQAHVEARERLNVEKKALDALVTKSGVLAASHTRQKGTLEDTRLDRASWIVGNDHKIAEKVELAKNEMARAKAVVLVDMEPIRAEMLALDAKLAGMKAEQLEESRLMRVFEDQRREWERAGAAITASKEIARQLNRETTKIADHVGKPCGECGRAYTPAEIEPAMLIIAEKLRVNALELRELERAEEDACSECESARSELEEFRATMTDASETSALRASTHERLMKAGELARHRQSLIDNAKFLVSEVATLRAAPNPFEAGILRLEKEIFDLDDEIAALKITIDAHTQAVRIAGHVVEVFAPAGVRAHILDHVTPFLNGQTAKYLSVLSDGNINASWSTLTKSAKGELREKFAIEVDTVSGGSSFGLISGGEKRKVRIATALALQDLVAQRATKPIELLMADEIDDALDSTGLERLMMILTEKAREKGTVIIISHNDLKDWIPNVLTITKRDGYATIEETTE